MFLGLLTLSLGTVMSCKDDDEKGSDPEQKGEDPYDKQSEEATALYRIVKLLAETNSLPDDWKTTSFEPTQGNALDETKPFVRSMAVSDEEEARPHVRPEGATSVRTAEGFTPSTPVPFPVQAAGDDGRLDP